VRFPGMQRQHAMEFLIIERATVWLVFPVMLVPKSFCRDVGRGHTCTPSEPLESSGRRDVEGAAPQGPRRAEEECGNLGIAIACVCARFVDDVRALLVCDELVKGSRVCRL
jgi:hypothetical protein